MNHRNRQLLRLALAATFLAACSGGGDGVAPTTTSGGGSASTTAPSDSTTASTDTTGDSNAPKAGGTVYVLSQSEDFNSLDPQRNYLNTDMAFALSTMQRTLTSYAYAAGADGTTVVPDLATDTGTPSDGAKTWSFTLRDGVSFEDGSAITCADVAYGVSRTFATDVITGGPAYAMSFLDVADGAYPGPYKSTADQQAAFDKAIECSADGKTVTFHLKVPVADFNATLTLPAFSPVPKSKDTGEGYGKAPVSSGPYRIESYEPGKEAVFVRNENWDPASDPIRHAYPDKYVYQFALDGTVINERLIADQGDDQVAVSPEGLLPENLPVVFGDDAYASRRIDAVTTGVSYTAFNVGSVSCKDLRRAIWLSIDRAAIKLANGGEFGGDLAHGFVTPVLATDHKPATMPEGWNEDGSPNVDAAKAALEAAKTSCPDLYTKATTTGLKYDVLAMPAHEKETAIFVESAKAAGIVINANPIESSQYFATVLDPTAQGDMSWGGWSPDWANASTVIPELFSTAGGFNLSHNGDDPTVKDFDAKVATARAETDRAAQGTMWQQLDQYVVDQGWAIPMQYGRGQDLYGSKLRNVYAWDAFACVNFGDLAVGS